MSQFSLLRMHPCEEESRPSEATEWISMKSNNRMSREYQLRCRRVTEVGLNAVRVSTHIFNSEADCDRVAEAVAAILDG